MAGEVTDQLALNVRGILHAHHLPEVAEEDSLNSYFVLVKLVSDSKLATRWESLSSP